MEEFLARWSDSPEEVIRAEIDAVATAHSDTTYARALADGAKDGDANMARGLANGRVREVGDACIAAARARAVAEVRGDTPDEVAAYGELTLQTLLAKGARCRLEEAAEQGARDEACANWAIAVVAEAFERATPADADIVAGLMHEAQQLRAQAEVSRRAADAAMRVTVHVHAQRHAARRLLDGARAGRARSRTMRHTVVRTQPRTRSRSRRARRVSARGSSDSDGSSSEPPSWRGAYVRGAS
jgi:hypothetical protein